MAKATCKTCGKPIRVPQGWTVGPAVRRHYWKNHRERMDQKRVDQAATRAIPRRGSN